jgi:hypothetical protein
MSEPLFPASGSTMTAPAPAEPHLDEPSGGNRKVFLALAGVGAVLVAGAGAFFLLSSGGGDEVEAPIVAPPKASAPADPGAQPSSAAKPTVVVKPAAVAADKPSTTTGSTDPTTSGTGATPAPSASSTTGTPSTTTSVTLGVSGIKPATQSATISVDGKKYAAVVGETFGKYYVLYSVFNAKCVGVLMGDQSVAVCSTAPVTVTP